MVKDILLVTNHETYVLQNVLHIAFWQAVEQRVKTWTGEEQLREKFPGKLLTQWQAFHNAVLHEDHYYLLANSSEYTAQIEAQDKLRDDIYRKLKKMVDTYAAVDFDQAKHEAALVMQPIMKRYAIDVNAAYEIETTKMDQWIDEQNTNAQAEHAATTLGIATQISALKAANDEVRKLISWRMDEQAEAPQAALKTARAKTDEEWKWFVLTLNSYAVADEIDYRFEELIRAINAEIAYSKEQYEALKKKNASDRDKASGGSNGGGGSQGGNTPAPTPKPSDGGDTPTPASGGDDTPSGGDTPTPDPTPSGGDDANQ